MTSSSSRIDLGARRLLLSVAGTRHAQVSAMALEHSPRPGKALMEAGLIVRRGSAMSIVAEDDLDDTPTSVICHPTTGELGHLGNVVWQEEQASARRRVYALDMVAAARRVFARLDCSLGDNPVPYLDGAVLDFGTARLPKRNARVGIWVARGLTTPAVFAEFRKLVARRPADGLRVVLVLDLPDRDRFQFIRGHELVAVADVVDLEDGLAVAPEALSARLLKGPSDTGPVWVSGDGGVLIVHGRWHEFTGGKQKVAVAMLAEAWLSGDPVLPVARILEEAECGRSVKRLRDLFSGHPTWHEVIRESGSSAWLEV
ncbi:hypothetical protein [Paracoccus sanguinis]|nr:hypothetical protein [Paracoccus sanguinis]